MATATSYDPRMSVREARARYFEDNDFGPDGGYGASWVTLYQLGPLRLGFPNVESRVRAVRYHDLHHLATGYDTDMLGEAEISAWELASGCRDFYAAWVLNAMALPYGLLRSRERIEAAFARGCRTRNLYGEPFGEALLAEPLGELRRRLGFDDADEAPMSTAERARFRRMVALGLAIGGALVVSSLGFLAGLVALVWWLL